MKILKQDLAISKLNEKDINYEIVFSVSLIFSFLVWFILLCHNPNGIQLNVFFRKMQESFADFFYPLCYMSDRNPYFSTRGGPELKNYLPLAYIILYPFEVFHNYKNTSFLECLSSRLGMMSAVYWMLFISLLFLHSLYCLAKRLEIKPRVIGGFFVSGIFLFSFERGNLIILSTAMLNYFLSFYDSEDKRLRYMASLAISIASVLKIYPALFGILFLRKKQYKELIITIGSGIVLTFMPFLFFKNGFANIPKLLSNMKALTQIYGHLISFDSFGFSSSILLAFHHFKINDLATECLFYLYRIIIYVFSIISLIFAFCSKRRFNIIALITFSIIFLPSISFYYCGLYLFPLVLYFLSTTKERSLLLNLIMLFCLIIIFMPIQFGINTASRYINLNHFLGTCIGFVLWIYIIKDELLVLYGVLKDGRTNV
jgi:hypothetical protein